MSPQNQNPAQPAPQPDDRPLRTDIVSNIPLHQASGPVPVHETEDIDGIMKDVTHQLKKEDVKPAKRHLFGHKADAPAAHPVALHPAPATLHQPSSASGPVPRQPAPKPGLHPGAQPKAKSPAPVMVVIFTIIITGFLIAAALAAYKK